MSHAFVEWVVQQEHLRASRLCSGHGLDGTPWSSGPVDIITNSIVNNGMSFVTDSGQTIQTLNETVQLGGLLGETTEYATGFGELKLGIDFLTYAGSLAVCAE